jgi:hypothetical protein
MDELRQLEATGRYLFHGSMVPNIKELNPRQALSFMQPDGAPAVCASEAIEPPIFMAVLGSRKLGGWGKKELPGFGFYIQSDDLMRAKQESWRGYVYIVNRSGFTKHQGYEWRSERNAQPSKFVEVGVEDLPSDIYVMTSEEYLAILRNA